MTVAVISGIIGIIATAVGAIYAIVKISNKYTESSTKLAIITERNSKFIDGLSESISELFEEIKQHRKETNRNTTSIAVIEKSCELYHNGKVV